MAEWRDRAIVLDAFKFGENDAIIHGFTREHGAARGMMKGALSKRNRALIEPGTLVEMRWNARLESHLGSVQLELHTPVAAQIMADPLKLAAVAALSSLLKSSLPEHDPHPALYDAVEEFLLTLHHASAAEDWLSRYITLEIQLLEELGFGLDLSACATTGTTRNLTHVSPKSGRAVSEAAAEPYRDKLLPLPEFLKAERPVSGWAELADGLRLSAHFLEHWLFGAIHQPLPPLRQRLEEQVGRKRQFA